MSDEKKPKWGPKACPNPECEDSDPRSECHRLRVWYGCQTCDTRAAYVEVGGDSAADWDAAREKARRLWDALPREVAIVGPSREWLAKAGDAEDAAGGVSVGGLAADLGMYKAHATAPGEATRQVLEALRAAVAGTFEGVDYPVQVEVQGAGGGVGETWTATVFAALRECGMEVQS